MGLIHDVYYIELIRDLKENLCVVMGFEISQGTKFVKYVPIVKSNLFVIGMKCDQGILRKYDGRTIWVNYGIFRIYIVVFSIKCSRNSNNVNYILRYCSA